MVDGYGRRFRYLRVSVTDRCNLRCEYCNPNALCPALAPEPLTWEDLHWMVERAVVDLGLEALRVTGGEPTVRPGLVEWVRRTSGTTGLKEICLTTNGIRLEAMAAALAKAGVSRVNISMDSLRPERFRAITRGGDLGRVLGGIQAAMSAFARVKVNVVALRHRNLDELADFVSFSDREGIEVRFIEPMPLGDEKEYWREVFVSAEELRARFEAVGLVLEAADRSGWGPASTFRVQGTRAVLGFISQMSSTKCASCNKLRLTSDGVLRPCLLSPQEVPLAEIVSRRDAVSFSAALRGAFLGRAREYSFDEAVTGSLGRSMQCIGG